MGAVSVAIVVLFVVGLLYQAHAVGGMDAALTRLLLLALVASAAGLGHWLSRRRRPGSR